MTKAIKPIWKTVQPGFISTLVAEDFGAGAWVHTRARTWRERLLSWPWKPWLKTETRPASISEATDAFALSAVYGAIRAKEAETNTINGFQSEGPAGVISWREAACTRVSEMAGVDSDGSIIPPPVGVGIDRTANSWWRNYRKAGE